MKTIAFEITGQVPGLLVNRFHEDAQAEATRGIHQRHQDWPEAKVDAASRLYVLNGDMTQTMFPAENLRQACIRAAGRHKIGRRSASEDMAAALTIMPDRMPLSGGWIVDERPVVIPATKGRVIRYRPLFPQWVIVAELVFDETLVDERLVRTVLDDAGRYVGIGDFRPAKKGPYGRFTVTSWRG